MIGRSSDRTSRIRIELSGSQIGNPENLKRLIYLTHSYGFSALYSAYANELLSFIINIVKDFGENIAMRIQFIIQNVGLQQKILRFNSMK